MRRRLYSLWICACLGVGSSACASEAGWSDPNLGVMQFKTDVYPVLIRDCAFQACHGAPERFFRIWGPGRVRLSPQSTAFSDATTDEVTRTYERARSMVDREHPERSLLLRKALATEAGGAGHLGADKFGRNVYRTVDDDGYLKLSRWVFSEMQRP